MLKVRHSDGIIKEGVFFVIPQRIAIFAAVNEIEDGWSPIFCYMSMKKEEIIQAVETAVQERGCFIVEVTVNAMNDVEIVIEKEEGIVDWDDCAAIDAVVHAAFDQDVEDYSLTVSSAGLDRPFKVFRQFLKAVGQKVDVKFKGGRRLVATLAAATEDAVTLQYTALEAVEGKKKKEKVDHEETYSLADINSVTPYIDFK
jgi:ribosome maturation factor RimP